MINTLKVAAAGGHLSYSPETLAVIPLSLISC